MRWPKLWFWYARVERRLRTFLRRVRLDLPFVLFIDESGMARFFRRGVSKIKFLPAVANKAAPTRVEITAGTALAVDIVEVRGFSISNSPIATPDLDTQFTKTIQGEDTVEDSGFTFHDQDNSSTIRTALAKGTAGFILLLPYGDVPTKRCEVWPVRSTGVNDVWTTDNESAKYNVGFAVTDQPEQAAVVPA
jgi:hypothetical protein